MRIMEIGPPPKPSIADVRLQPPEKCDNCGAEIFYELWYSNTNDAAREARLGACFAHLLTTVDILLRSFKRASVEIVVVGKRS